ncbi:MAG: MBOAT family protein [Ruminococcus sp.]|nr:MBOAT family protein [Ruminococcus sp.]
MAYSSLLFIYGFLPVSLLVFYITPAKLKNGVLLLLSMVFCALVSLDFLVLISAYTLVNYIFCLLTDKLRAKHPGLAVVPFVLGFMFDFMAIFLFRSELLSSLRGRLPLPDSFYPVGISFFTLSAAGALMDVFSGKHRAERNIVRFALFIMMFPRLLMGPLLRFESFSKILRERRGGLAEIGVGFTLFAKGLAKKVIIADTMYRLWSAVCSQNIASLAAVNAWIGIIAYLLCLYFTLSGVADMGTGIGYCFGFRFPQSFNYPLFSTRIRDFAARWHIQPVQWFRRYVTKPLYSLGTGKWYRRFIYIIAWGTLGAWYTFSANGLVWGLLIGSAVIAERYISRMKLLKTTSIIYTFLLTIVCTVFFAGETLVDSMHYLVAMLGGSGVIADTLTVYLLRCYSVVLLVGMYASTDLFRNMMIRSGKNKLQTAFSAVTPVTVLLLFTVCTALIAHSGTSAPLLIEL